MKILRAVILVFVFLLPSANVFGAVSSFNDSKSVVTEEGTANGIAFNPDGTKMYVVGFVGKIFEYALSTPFTVSSASYSTGEDCDYTSIGDTLRSQDLKFSSDGTAVFVASRDVGIFRFSLTTPYDVSTCDVAARETHTVKAQVRSIVFNGNGSKLFILNQIGTLYEVNEYSLSNPYNLNGMILSKTATNFGGNFLRDLDSFAQGLGFSHDGSKMFYTGNNQSKVHEFTLNPPYNISNATLEGSYDVSENDEGTKGITFSSNGLKMYLADFVSGNHVSEYSLTCSFGVITCIDPTSSPDDVAQIETQNESAKQLMQHTTSPVLNRMAWLRRNKERLNLTNQNIKFQFSNEILRALNESLIPIYFSNDNSIDANSQNNNWSYWSEGTISIGRVGDTLTSSTKNINTTAVTFGADRKDENNIMRGLAFRLGNDDVDVGNFGSAFDMSAMSLTFYESRPRGENKYIDNLIGFSFIQSDIINNSGSISAKGERDGAQIFGSFNLRDTYTVDNLNVTPKFKINAGITQFQNYDETGAEGMNLRFDKQHIGNLITAIGTSVDNTYEFKNAVFIPYYDFEYYADISPSSEQKFSTISDGRKFVIKNINNSTHNFKNGIGFDYIKDNGLNLMTKYTRDQAEGGNQNESFIIALDYKFSKNSSYAFSVQDSSTKLSHKNEFNGFYVNLDSNYDIFSDDPEYGVYVKISNQP